MSSAIRALGLPIAQRLEGGIGCEVGVVLVTLKGLEKQETMPAEGGGIRYRGFLRTVAHRCTCSIARGCTYGMKPTKTRSILSRGD